MCCTIFISWIVGRSAMLYKSYYVNYKIAARTTGGSRGMDKNKLYSLINHKSREFIC